MKFMREFLAETCVAFGFVGLGIAFLCCLMTVCYLALMPIILVGVTGNIHELWLYLLYPVGAGFISALFKSP